MTKIFLFISICAEFWAGIGGESVQATCLALIALAAIFSLRLEMVLSPRPVLLEVSLFGAAILSVLTTSFRGDYFLCGYSALFLITIASVSIIARSLTLEEILDVSSLVIFTGFLSFFILDFRDLVTAFSIVIGHTGLFRFGPFGMHPNLLGLIFGAGSILLVRMTVLAKSHAARILFGLSAMGAVAFVVAGSARSSLLALAVAILYGYFAAGKSYPRLYKRSAVIAVAVSALFITIGINKIGGYLGRILELESKTRGIGSGGTGRFQVWLRGISEIFADPMRFVFGGGLRSSDTLGFTTEDSYIALALDMGVPLASLVIGCLCFSLYLVIAKYPGTPKNAQTNRVTLGSFFIFLLVESIFNRYLIAIGNPISLIFLLAVVSVSVRAELVRRRMVLSKSRRDWYPSHSPTGN
jgi:exopolysaccharide production protein ExoQ